MIKYIALFILSIVFGVTQFISYRNMKKGLNTMKTNSKNAKQESADGEQRAAEENNASQETK